MTEPQPLVIPNPAADDPATLDTISQESPSQPPTREEAHLLWGDVLAMARERIEPAVLPWLDPERIHPYSFDGTTLVLVTRQAWTEKKVMKDYRPEIEKLIRETTLENISLEVLVDAELFQAIDEAPTTPQVTVNPGPADPTTPEPLIPANPDPQAPPAEELTREGALVSLDGSKGTVELRERESVEQAVIAQEALPAQTPIAPIAPISTIVTKDALASFTFESFVVGDANKMAYEAARNVAEDPYVSFNPLFLYSKSGLGKTHLLLAIANYIQKNRPDTYVNYVTSSKFVADYVDDIQNKKLKGKDVMRDYYKSDVLLVDDVQMFRGNQQSVSAFFDIFNRLMLDAKHIVLAADEPPDYLNLDERVRTRFGAGLVLDIAEPSYELKRSILLSYYLRQQREISWFKANLTDDDLDYIAEISPSSIREMQGFLTRISTMSATRRGKALTRAQIKAVRDELFKDDKPIAIETIVRVVALERGVSEEEILGKKQVKNISRARQECMWLARQLTDEPYQAIGAHFGRDHSTVYASISKIDRITKSDRTYQLEMEDMKKVIKNR